MGRGGLRYDADGADGVARERACSCSRCCLRLKSLRRHICSQCVKALHPHRSPPPFVCRWLRCCRCSRQLRARRCKRECAGCSSSSGSRMRRQGAARLLERLAGCKHSATPCAALQGCPVLLSHTHISCARLSSVQFYSFTRMCACQHDREVHVHTWVECRTPCTVQAAVGHGAGGAAQRGPAALRRRAV